ncbi:hypothetical protein [Lentzea sp. NPDC060358]|uniref:hypothetical protein n=1 Tax=Lentzea sp. NPDC060358 TaxID=3347103 RepID=UPI003646CD75
MARRAHPPGEVRRLPPFVREPRAAGLRAVAGPAPLLARADSPHQDLLDLAPPPVPPVLLQGVERGAVALVVEPGASGQRPRGVEARRGAGVAPVSGGRGACRVPLPAQRAAGDTEPGGRGIGRVGSAAFSRMADSAHCPAR